MKKICMTIGLIGILAVPAWAKPSPEFVSGIHDQFQAADSDRGFVTAQEPIDTNKIHGYAVIRKSGTPAGEAYWFISKQDYEYRPLIIENNQAKTYFGKVVVTLDPGTIMIVTSVETHSKTVIIRLLSKDIIHPDPTHPTTHDSRAGVAFVFKFPHMELTPAALPSVLSVIQQYIEPATDLVQAEQIAAQIRQGTFSAPVAAPKLPQPKPEIKEVKSVESSPGTAVTPAPATPATPSSPAKPATPVGVIRSGMSFDEVKKVLGEPRKTSTRASSVVFDYGDREVIFVNSKVYDIRYK